MPESTFIGRKQHQEQFTSALDKSNPNYIINLRGGGGIGKTKILEQFRNTCQEDSIPYIGIIDFYSSVLSSQIIELEQTIVSHLTPILSTPLLVQYEATYHDYTTNQDIRLERQLKKQFLEILPVWNEQAQASLTKHVLLCDTFEKVKENLVGSRILNEWLPQLPNVVLVLAGRQLADELDFPSDIAGQVIDAPVGHFNPTEATDYLRERRVWQIIAEEGAAEQLFELTQLRPLLLALSADWLKSKFGPNISVNDLIAGANQNNFEQKLIENFVRIEFVNYPERVVLPYMAHIYRPFDKELLDFLIPDISAESTQILQNLSQSSFIKEYAEEGQAEYWFHDEVRSLFEKHIFVDTRRWNDLRCEASERMIAFYDRKIAKAASVREQQQYRAEQMYHRIYLNPEQGYTEYHQQFQNARLYDRQIEFAAMLTNAIRPLIKDLDEENQFVYHLNQAQLSGDFGKHDLAKKQGYKLLTKYQTHTEKLIYIFNTLGGSLEKLGELPLAKEYFEKSLMLREQLDLTDFLYQEKRNIARVLRLMGYWNEAVNQLSQTTEIIFEYNQGDELLLAEVWVEQGDLLGLLSHFEGGLDYCNEAIEIYETHEEKSIAQLIRAYTKRGAVYRYDDQFDEAEVDLRKAIQLFEAHDDITDANLLAEAYLWLGANQRDQAEQANSDEKSRYLLDEAIQSLNISRDLAKTMNNSDLLCRALTQLSIAYWNRGYKAEGRRLNREAYQLAQDTFNVYQSIINIIKIAEFDYEDGHIDRIPDHVADLKKNYEDKDYLYPLHYGDMRRLQGRIALDKQNDEQAIRYYAAGLLLATKLETPPINWTNWYLDLLEKRFSQLEDQARIVNLYKDLRAELVAKSFDRRRPGIIRPLDRLIRVANKKLSKLTR